ncbi:MAG: bifunctional 3-deoxy-7-phosphoheptulonate synthase/chorismate mutase type II [Bacteroidales bacterium]|nr:bifunctional 3-deoxy-7-phosphoheptulonate synthase/chorismate mutase type II [Bacteroidales bacterium]MDT8430016.1 bifunctional 3-deoxy-7-phosphoheptulonate synthase/chorismate mutase type II [Bacteroidales bacterium]
MVVDVDLKPLTLKGLDKKRPLIMAGPCSAESEEQVLNTARMIAAMDIPVFRAGIWKPRTRPNAFEGVGSVGLPWLQTVKQETGMLVSTEVANVKHVYEALKYGIDIIWIGARTSANPFAVQEIADSLKGVKIPVFVKNPVNPDIDLWIGAIERINQAGIEQIAAIHRGFSSYEKSIYRNAPHWQVPIELRRRIPDLPIITDPSHICGSRDLLYDISQKAMDLNFDGLIIETHEHPDKAWSDAKQQVTPEGLKNVLDRLILRKPDLDETMMLTLAVLRDQIDKLDDKLINLIEERMKVVESIGNYKKENNITILQNKRWDDMLKSRLILGERKGLSEDFISKLFRAIHQESINKQTRIMNDE